MIEVTRTFEFDAGHRVLAHGGKCRYLHGHRYKAEVTVTTPDLDHLSIMVDFGVIKEVIGKWIDENWDHNILLHPDDPLWTFWRVDDRQDKEPPYLAVFGGRKPYLMPDGCNPTAEMMAKLLFRQASCLLGTVKGCSVLKVRIYETPNCWADCYSRG
jgi:6-pyruvoyltetrahydropterin/6-carboxytetrahydropterin synthase